MKLEELVQVSAAVAGTRSRLAKIEKLADLFTRFLPDDVPIAIGFLTGWPRQGKLGVGWASVAAARAREPAAESVLELRDVDSVFDQLLSTQGRNSGNERARLLGDMFARATAVAREVRRDRHVVYVRPELVVEIAFNEVQHSTQYPGGAELRFARVKGYRPDRSAAEADTIEAVRAYLPGV